MEKEKEEKKRPNLVLEYNIDDIILNNTLEMYNVCIVIIFCTVELHFHLHVQHHAHDPEDE